MRVSYVEFIAILAAFWVLFVIILYPVVGAVSFVISRQLLEANRIAMVWYDGELRAYLNGQGDGMR